MARLLPPRATATFGDKKGKNAMQAQNSFLGMVYCTQNITRVVIFFIYILLLSPRRSFSALRSGQPQLRPTPLFQWSPLLAVYPAPP